MSEKTSAELYAALAEKFDKHGERTQGGATLTYATGEQVISRLNEVLGPDCWEFAVLEHGINAEADEVWIFGQLTAHFPSRSVTRQQFGSQKLKRSRSDGNPLDLGFDLKGATTDSLKKCASMIGVALYLYDKDELAEVQKESRNGRAVQPVRPPTRGPVNRIDPTQPDNTTNAPAPSGVGDEVVALIGRFIKVANKAQYESARAESSALWSVIDDEDKARITEAATAARERVAAPVGA